jgi:hypothetical protein
MQISLSCFMLFLQTFSICCISKVLGTIPAWVISNIRQHFSRLLFTWHINTEYFSLFQDLKEVDKKVLIFCLTFHCLYVMSMTSHYDDCAMEVEIINSLPLFPSFTASHMLLRWAQ